MRLIRLGESDGAALTQPGYFLPLRLDGVWASALAAALFSVLVLFLLASTLPAAEAALRPVWRLLRATPCLLPTPSLQRTEAGLRLVLLRNQAALGRLRRRRVGLSDPLGRFPFYFPSG
jgi:hypothetical protein